MLFLCLPWHSDDSSPQTVSARHSDRFINAHSGLCNNILISQVNLMFAYWDWTGSLSQTNAWWARYGCSSFLLSHLPQTACQWRALIGARFPFCQHKHAGKGKWSGDKAKTLTGVKEPIICDHLWPVSLMTEGELRFGGFYGGYYIGRKCLACVYQRFICDCTAWTDERIGMAEMPPQVVRLRRLLFEYLC